MKSETKICQNCNDQFVIEPEDSAFYEKISVPPPTFCPECRFQRRLSWRNERGLFRRKCDAPGHEETLISIYRPEEAVVVYDHDYWHSDAWDPTDYGVDYDFNKPLFEQFKKLFSSVPLIALFDSRSTDSSYCNITVDHKNCYLVSAGWNNEDSFHSNRISYCRDVCDSYVCHKVELGYENVFCKESNKLFYSRNSKNCVDSYFLYDCRNCINCVGCVSLRNKSYCIFNKQYTKEEYNKWLAEHDIGNRDVLVFIAKESDNLYSKTIHRFAQLVKTENCVGDNIENSQNCYYCFDLAGEAQNAKYCNWGTYGLHDSYDTGPGTGGKSELTYEGISIGVANSRCAFGAIVWYCRDVYYSVGCENCSDCFGCVSLRGKKHCILNKQYTPEKYKESVEKIKKHMNETPYVDKKGRVYKYGEYFPMELSPYPYNVTAGQDYTPLTKEEALRNNYPWTEIAEKDYKATISLDDVPKSIKFVDEDIVSEIFPCENAGSNASCTKAFRMTKKEFDFYKKLNIPLPLFCPNCRHIARLQKRNPMKLWHRKCQCAGSQSENGIYKNTIEHQHGKDPCPNEFETSYAPDRPEIVYCERCYQQEVV